MKFLIFLLAIFVIWGVGFLFGYAVSGGFSKQDDPTTEQ